MLRGERNGSLWINRGRHSQKERHKVWTSGIILVLSRSFRIDTSHYHIHRYCQWKIRIRPERSNSADARLTFCNISDLGLLNRKLSLELLLRPSTLTPKDRLFTNMSVPFQWWWPSGSVERLKWTVMANFWLMAKPIQDIRFWCDYIKVAHDQMLIFWSIFSSVPTPISDACSSIWSISKRLGVKWSKLLLIFYGNCSQVNTIHLLNCQRWTS